MKPNIKRHSLVCIGALAAVLALAGCVAGGRCGRQSCEDDRAITSQVRSLLDQHPAIQAPNYVTVQTVDHVVYLRGLVDTPYEKRLAGSVAEQADGVARVINLIGLSNNR